MYDNNPFFAVNYTESSASGLIQAYYNYYYLESGQLIAGWVNPPVNNASIITESINNSFMFVLAANGESDCSIYSGGAFSTNSCYNNMLQTESIVNSSIPSQQIVSFNKNTESWPFLYGKPVSLIPDSANLKTFGYSQYMIPAYESLTGSNPSTALGYLIVEESQGAFIVQGFQSTGTSPGKTSPVSVGDGFYLGVYSAGAWYPGNNLITIESGAVSLTFGPATGSQFAYIVNDLTGAISTSESVAY